MAGTGDLGPDWRKLAVRTTQWGEWEALPRAPLPADEAIFLGRIGIIETRIVQFGRRGHLLEARTTTRPLGATKDTP